MEKIRKSRATSITPIVSRLRISRPISTARKSSYRNRPDLSFYNWKNQMIASNNTPNYQVIAENVKGLLFKNKRDRKIISVDPHVKFNFNLKKKI